MLQIYMFGLSLGRNNCNKHKQMGKIVLEGMEFYGFHGFYPEERIIGGRYLVDVELYKKQLPASDQLDDTVDYTVVYEIVSRHMHQSRMLIETLATGIKAELAVRFPETDSLVRISKLSPPVGGPIHRTFVEV